MPDLGGGLERINLGGGYVLVAPGLRGRAERIIAAAGDTRAAQMTTPILNEVLAANGMTTVANIEIIAAPVPEAGAVAELRDARGDDALVLEVPDLGPETGQIVLAVDEAGALTWNFPLEDGRIRPPATRGGSATRRFYIRRRVPPAPAPESTRDRALLGAVGRKLLKMIVFPITDLMLGAPATAIAEHWEKANRAYELRDFTPDCYRQPTVAPVMPTGPDLDRWAKGRALMFIHGAFSNAHGGFHDLPPEFMAELQRRYGGRVFAFNHFTMAHDPEQNVRWFAEAIRPMSAESLAVDVVCHSRGGLVARTLAEGKTLFGLDLGRVRVNRVAFVAAPNRGTLLADPDHMVEMLDRMTNVLNLFPPGGVADFLEGVLIGVKIIGHGALSGLVGLKSMNPVGAFLKSLNKGGRRDAQYFAVAANYEPTDLTIRSLVSRSADKLIDRIFEGADNDLVVPEFGVYEANGCDSFPIADERCLKFPGSAGVTHTTMFGRDEVVDRLSAWLRPTQ
jgi:pimeloyl-ACP methyl ester carboxylesterase